MKYMRLAIVAVLAFLTIGCSQRTTSTSEYQYAVSKHSQEKDLLEKEIAKISKNNTFPSLVESLKESMENLDSFQLVRADHEIRERYTHKPSGIPLAIDNFNPNHFPFLFYAKSSTMSVT